MNTEVQTALAEILIFQRELGEDAPDIAELVVAEAEEPDHPLHKHFCWDDNEAAHQYRLTQSRQLLRSFEFEKVEPVIRENFEMTFNVDRVTGPQMGSLRDGRGMIFISDVDPLLTLRHLTGEVPCSTSIPGLLSHCGDTLREAGLHSEIRSLKRIQKQVQLYLNAADAKEVA